MCNARSFAVAEEDIFNTKKKILLKPNLELL